MEWIIEMFLSDVWTLILTAPIHCRGSIGELLHGDTGLAKSLARRPGALVFSSRATKMYHRPARRANLKGSSDAHFTQVDMIL